MKKQPLFNKINRKILKKNLLNEIFQRDTVSFYKYFEIQSPSSFRDDLYKKFDRLNIFGRVYISKEGINAQISVPVSNWNEFIKKLEKIKDLKDISLKKALQDGKSFYKLTVKVKKELVAYNVPKNSYNMQKIGNHLTAEQYNKALDNPETLIVDMRNYYESEIGRFKGAIIPNVETSKELLPKVKNLLEGKEEKKILLYCTGGIRCEKASSFLIQNGFKNVNQLQGGIIQYTHEVKEKGLESKFIGKNFVFDERLGERVTEDIISLCHICKSPCDNHTDCNNDACHILFIQCNKCFKMLKGCCSEECRNFASLPLEKQKLLRKDPEKVVSKTFFDSRIKPKLKEKV
ncbi:MAG: rhodanese-related sulfurtransferase [Candidatus Neomarinimicrobiota bacterium]